MRAAMCRLLDLCSFGNHAPPGSTNAGATAKHNTTLLERRLKANGHQSLHRNWVAVHCIGPELPLLDPVNGSACKSERTLQEFCVLHRTVSPDQNLQNYRALLAF